MLPPTQNFFQRFPDPDWDPGLGLGLREGGGTQSRELARFLEPDPDWDSGLGLGLRGVGHEQSAVLD